MYKLAFYYIQRLAFLASLFFLTASPAWADVHLSHNKAQPVESEAQPDSQARELTAIPRLNELNSSATTIVEWLAQSPTATLQITGVELNLTGQGLGLLLETSGKAVQPTSTLVVGNTLIVNIDQAVLALPDGEEFEAVNPIEGIALVTVTPQPNNRVRVAIKGLNAPPTAKVRAETQGLLVSVDPGAAEEIQVVVRDEQNQGYNPSNSSTATGTDTPLRDIPLSIQVIPQEVIEDRNVTELEDALETAGSVVSVGGRGVSVAGPGFLIRGFEIDGGIFRDGIPAFSLAPLSTNDIESVEVLKGPASVLFGQAEPGGIINLVSKRPLSEPFYSASFTAGSFDTYRGDLDLSGPLNDSSTVKYRLNLSYENYESFRDFVDGERFIVSPIVAWDIGANTSINFYGQYISEQETIDEGIPVTENGIVDLPRDRFLGEDFAQFKQQQFRLGYRLDHQLSEDWSIRHVLQYLQYEPERFAPLFDSFDEITGELSRLEYFAGGTYRRFFTNAEAIARFDTGSIQHQVLFGAEYRHDAENPNFQFSNLYTPINVFNPVYTREPYNIAPDFFRDDNIDTIGIYLQDQIDFSPNLKVLLGVRYDYVDQFRTTQFLGEPREEFEQTDSAFTPRFGIVYQPIEPISLYASYTTSFNPSFGASRNGDDSAFEPETGRQYEVGMKADLSEQLSLTLAAFDIRKQNVETPTDDPIFSVQTGEVTSRGIELTLAGEILPGWNMIAAYTYLDAFVSEDNTDIVGNKLANAPDNQFSLWTRYDIQQGNLEGLGFGLGFLYLSDRPGNLANSFSLPSFFRTDAALFYQRDQWRAQLNIENLFDIEYFSSSDQSLGVIPGAARAISATIAVEF